VLVGLVAFVIHVKVERVVEGKLYRLEAFLLFGVEDVFGLLELKPGDFFGQVE